MIDYHIHPDYSIDAEPFSMEEYCRKAIKIGLKEICFTTHLEFDPVRKKLDWFVRCRDQVLPMHPVSDWLDIYFDQVDRCARIYSSQGLKVKAGIEAGYDLGLEKSIKEVLDAYPFDFVIGSIHCLDHVAISSQKESRPFYACNNLQQVTEAYYKTLSEGIKSGLFDVIGHLDIYRRHGTSFYGDEAAFVYKYYIQNILKDLVRTGTGLELNTSSFRHGQGLFYPQEEILSEAIKAGVSVYTVGSDCHRLSELGMGVGQAIGRARRLGLNICSFDKRKASPISF